MELEMYSALLIAGVPESEAKAAVESVFLEIDKRFLQHTQQLATKSELSEAKVEIIRWTVGSMLALVALSTTISRIWH